MDKITFIEVEGLGGVVEHVIIEHADGSFTSMTKAHYEELNEADSL
jgi:hypothetical protein